MFLFPAEPLSGKTPLSYSRREADLYYDPLILCREDSGVTSVVQEFKLRK